MTIAGSYDKPESYAVVEVPLPTLRDNDVLVCISYPTLVLFFSWNWKTDWENDRSKSRLAVSVEL